MRQLDDALVASELPQSNFWQVIPVTDLAVAIDAAIGAAGDVPVGGDILLDFPAVARLARVPGRRTEPEQHPSRTT